MNPNKSVHHIYTNFVNIFNRNKYMYNYVCHNF